MEVMWTELRDQHLPADHISNPAKTEDLDSYQNAIEEFQENDWTYIPMPEDGKYYNIKKEAEPENLVDDQFIEPELHLLEVMKKLLDLPFLLIENNDGSYSIIHLSNLNDRRVKSFIHPLISELENQLSKQIEDYYEKSEDLFGQVSEFTLGTWYKARIDDVELHIAEFLTLGNMIGIIKGHKPLMDKCGFKENDDVDKLGGIENLRNRVMHGNRTLVNNKETLKDHIDRIERAEQIVQRLH